MLTVVSYNVMFNDILLLPRHQVLVKLLLKNSSDVICLQEIQSGFAPWFIECLAEQYAPVLYSLNPELRQYGELIFVKYGIEQLLFECIPLPSKMGRALQYVQIKKDAEIWNIITFHLESLNCSKVRQNQLGILWENYGDLPHTIFCGDTNMRDTEKCDLPEHMSDAWIKTDGKIGQFTYFSDRYWDGDRKQRYDKIWVTNDMQVTGFGVLGNKPLKELGEKWISDHDGLYLCVY